MSRTLDALIAEHVFGYDMNFCFSECGKEYYYWLGPNSVLVPRYSTQIQDAWLVVEKMTENEDTSIEIVPDAFNKECTVSIQYWDDEHKIIAGPFYFTKPTFPEAACLAALKALGVDGEN